jgi:hypothetical protein
MAELAVANGIKVVRFFALCCPLMTILKPGLHPKLKNHRP